MRRKGAAEMNWVMVSLIVVLAAAAILVVAVVKSGKAAEQTRREVTPRTLQAQIVTCRASSAGFQDTDGDKLADFCDPCMGGKESVQSDPDFLSDACDLNPKKADADPIVACCGTKPPGETIEEMQKACPRLLAVEPFQCQKA